MASESSDSPKPQIKIGILGSAGHGKTVLARALLAVQAAKGLASSSSSPSLLEAEGVQAPGPSPSAATAEYRSLHFETEARHYEQVDFLRPGSAVKNMITGAVNFDGAIIVVSAVDGADRQTEEHVRMARSNGVPKLVVYLNKSDLAEDNAIIDLVELELRELLSRYQYSGDDVPVVKGSAQAALEGKPEAIASLEQLLAALDTYIPTPPKPADLPLLMSIEDVFTITGRGTVATGRVERGKLSVGSEVEIVGQDATQRATVAGVEMYRRMLDHATAGDNVGIVFREGAALNLQRGQVVAAPASIQPHRKARTEIYLLAKEEGGREVPFSQAFRPTFYFRTTDTAGTIKLPEGQQVLKPGETTSADIELITPTAMQPFQRFAIREGGRAVAVGRIVEIIPEAPSPSPATPFVRDPPASPPAMTPPSRPAFFPPRTPTPQGHGVGDPQGKPPTAPSIGQPSDGAEPRKIPSRVVNAELTVSRFFRGEKTVEPNLPLNHRADYKLVVQIGPPRATSLVTAAPALDPLLPAPQPKEKGWTLEVVVFAKSFHLKSAASQPLFLPRQGSSADLAFELRTPDAGEYATLRFGVYHRNQLLQSFALRANLSSAPLATEVRQIDIVCDFSQTELFTNIDALPPRVLSLGLNDDGSSDTHYLSIKGTRLAAGVKLDEDAMLEITREFREIMRRATMDDEENPRFPLEPSAEFREDFDEVIRNLSRLGKRMFEGLFNDCETPVWAALAEAPDLPIQIVRHKINHAYPWNIVYDFRLPEEVAGEKPAPVCRGEVDGAPCTCNRETTTNFCLKGFWGIRHQLEQLAGVQSSYADAADVIRCHPDSPQVVLAYDQNEPIVVSLEQDLQTRFSQKFVPLKNAQTLLQELWADLSRPAVFVAFGRMQTADVQGEPIGPRLLMVPGNGWLQPRKITDETISHGKWKDPSSLVFLMMCHSGATEIAKLNDFTQAFVRAGASGVLGAETYIFRGYAKLFVTRIVAELANKKSIGEAIQRFRRERAAAGDPLGFGFTYIGCAGLKLL